MNIYGCPRDLDIFVDRSIVKGGANIPMKQILRAGK